MALMRDFYTEGCMTLSQLIEFKFLNRSERSIDVNWSHDEMNHWMHISTHLGPFYRVLRSKKASTHSLAHDLIFIIES